MLDLWIKTLGRTFYIQHAGLFLFVFYLIFGAIDPSQMIPFQLSLLYTISSSVPATAGFCVVLLLYGLKAGAFVRQQLSLPAYHFTREVTALKSNLQYFRWLRLYAVLFCPLLIYAVLIVGAGLYSGHILTALMLMAWSTFVLFALSVFSYRNMNRAHAPETRGISGRIKTVYKPYYSWRLFYLIKQQTIMLVACKVLSLLMFKGIVWALNDTEGDKRYLIGMLAAVLSHSVLVAALLNFERTQLAFTHGLPISHWKRITALLAFFLILFIPELLIYGNFVGFHIPAVFAGISCCLGGLTCCYFLLYLFKGDMERYLYFIFIFFVGSMLSILYEQAVVFSLLLLVGGVIYHRYLCRNAML